MFARLDVIATLLDNVVAMTKFATHKTAGVLGDDLARGELLVHGTFTLMAPHGKGHRTGAAEFLAA